MGIDIGVTHTELKLTPKGAAIVEIGARLGGDKIPYLIKLATGVDIAAEAIKVALGENCTINTNKITAYRGSAIKFIIPNEGGELLEYPDVKKVSKNPNVEELYFKHRLGKLHLPPEKFFTRLGFILTSGVDSDCAYKTACDAITSLDLKYV